MFDRSRSSRARGHDALLPPWRLNLTQLIVACSLTVLLGGSLQLNKLAVLDAAGRQFLRESYGSKTAFLVPFAVLKAICNLVVGGLADRYGRKRIAVAGWAVGLLAPLVVLAAPAGPEGWDAVVSSAAFLGMQQGLVWTCLILVMMDLCGAAARGFASGLSETVGYTAIAVFAQVYGAVERSAVRCAWTDEWTDGRPPAGSSPRSPQCVAKSDACDGPDDWVPACVGSCRCSGYTTAPFHAQLALMLVGLALTVSALRESLWRRRESGGLGDGGGIRMREMSKDGGEFVEFVDEASDDEEAGKLSLEGGGRARGGSGGGGGGGAGLRGMAEARGGALGEAPRVAAGSNEPLARAFVRTSFTHRSLAAVCVAGFCANFETGMAWGLIASWARDGLGVDGRERDFFTGAYSFLKGLSQLFAGLASDRLGRKAPMLLGLVGGAASLALAAFGAGFGGDFLPGSDGDAPDANDGLRFGYLVLSGALLGLFTGLMYPVLAAAAADHAPAGRLAGTIGTVRFWRDLGYAMGTPVAAVADAATPETALLLVAGLMLAAGGVVAVAYEEAMPNEGGVDGGRRGGAAAAEEEEEEEEEERERVERRLVGGGGEREGETRVG